jgi:6-phosphogluconolactonase (cycloisomerase 2 family)
MSKKIGFVITLVGLCALSLFLVNCGSSSSHPSGILYVLTQAVTAQGGADGIGNNVSSFAIDLNTGNLTLINTNASTCPTAATSSNPEPCGLPLSILLDPTGATAFVLNQGIPCAQGVTCVDPCGPPSAQCVSVPPTIYPYTVKSDGSLSDPGTPITLSHPLNAEDTQDDANLALAMVRDTTGQFVYVINRGSSPPPTNCPAPPVGNFDACPSISVLAMMPGSTALTLESGSPFYLSKIPTALSAVEFTPSGSSTAQEFLFVTNSQDICNPPNCVPPSPHNDNTLSVYSVSSSGVVTEQTAGGSPYTVPSSDPISVLAVNTTPAGQNLGGVFVYVGSQPSAAGALNIFQMCTQSGQGNCTTQQVTNETLVPLLPVPPAPGEQPVGMVVDPTSNYLYVVCEQSNQVFGYRITGSTGVLTPLVPASQPSQGSQPVALVMQPSVNQSGEFLFVSNSNSSNIGGFTVSTATGAMSNPINVISNPGPSGMAAQQ